MNNRFTAVLWASVLSLAFGGPAMAAGEDEAVTGQVAAPEELANARDVVEQAAEVVEQLRADPETRETLKEANAVFIVPDYGRAALGVGGAGGQGVLIANNDGQWSAPAFYNIGTINLGLEAGIEAGEVAFFILSDDALQGFRDEHNFSLNADAGLTVINWSRRAQASVGKGADVIAWSSTEGLYGDLAVSATDIFWDEEANRVFYEQRASASDIISGQVQAPEAAGELKSEFSALESESPSGQPTIPGRQMDPGQQPIGEPE